MKDNLPYFEHDNDACQHPKMRSLIAEYGFEGYGRFWVLNEKIARSSGTCINISKKVNKLDLANELGLDGDRLDEFIAFLSDPEIDLINYQNGMITTDRVTESFAKVSKSREKDKTRRREKPEIHPTGNSGFPSGNMEVSDLHPENEVFQPENAEIHSENNTDKIREDEIREDEIKENSEAAPPDVSKNFSSSKPKKPPLRKREPENDYERVEKAYYQNWDLLYSQGKVKTQDPVVNWNQTRKLLKSHFEKLKPEQIIQAVNNGLNDDWVLNAGYSLGAMLSATVLNRLINSSGSGPQQQGKKFLE